MASIQPHINFNGNAEEAFHFYQSVFGGEFSKIVRFKDLAGPGFEIDKEEENKLMNIALSIGDNVLIGNDVPQFMGRVSEEENRSKIAIFAASHRIFPESSIFFWVCQQVAQSRYRWLTVLGAVILVC